MHESSIDILEVLAELNKGRSVLSEEDIRRAEKEINEDMRKFDIEHRRYMTMSRESASHAYINC